MKWNPETKIVLSYPERKEPWLKRFWEMIQVFTFPEHQYWIVQYAKEVIGRSEKIVSCMISRKIKLKFVFWCHNLILGKILD